MASNVMAPDSGIGGDCERCTQAKQGWAREPPQRPNDATIQNSTRILAPCRWHQKRTRHIPKTNGRGVTPRPVHIHSSPITRSRSRATSVIRILEAQEVKHVAVPRARAHVAVAGVGVL